MLLLAVADAGLGLLLQQTEQRKVVGGVVALGETGPRSLLGLFGLDDIELVAGGDGEGLAAKGAMAMVPALDGARLRKASVKTTV
jgi:hypothetical protein